MRYELLCRRLVLPIVAALLLAASTMAAQEAAPVPAAQECFPKCRSGYLCHEGACITGCNPACADDEKCTAEGECVAKATPTPVVTPVVPAPVHQAPPPKPPYVHHKVAVGLSAGALLCVSDIDTACNTRERDAGVYTSLRGGYLALPWLVVDLDVSFSPLFMKSSNIADSAFLLSAGLGARFLPLARRGKVDLVLGLHVGYFLARTKNTDLSQSENTSLHGVHLAYTAGLEFNLAPAFSLGVALDVFEPFWVATCDNIRFVPADPLVPGSQSQPSTTTCGKPTGDSHPIYFGVGLSGSFLL
jgi:hypothetical protein